MENGQHPKRLILINIDALKPDVLQKALADETVPNLAKIVGGQKVDKGIAFEPLSTAPSITFCSQATIITGTHPKEHGITGNQFFDRFGTVNGSPRHYAFDAGGHRMAFDDALGVFRSGLANKALSENVETLYETANRHGKTSSVIFNMYSRGADHWVKPGPDDWRNFFSFGDSFGISSAKYDEAMMNAALKHLDEGNEPDVLSIYFWGLDHDSHTHGPSIQYDYLTKTVDGLVGQLLDKLEARNMMDGAVFVVFSDHGQKEVPKKSEFCLQLAFPPLDVGMGHIFRATKRDVLDLPGERKVDTVVSMNGGTSHVYIRRKGWNRWKTPARFRKDVLPIADAMWESVVNGRFYNRMYNALTMILVRDIEHEGWDAPFKAYTPQGLIPVEEFLAVRPMIKTADPINRLAHIACENSGDILLVSNIEDGFYFAFPYAGIHGSLNPEDSVSTLYFSLPKGNPDQIYQMRKLLNDTFEQRTKDDHERDLNIVDIAPAIRKLMNWSEKEKSR